jgi:hypothetical protein
MHSTLNLRSDATVSTLNEILAERYHQIEECGWTVEHDDLHGPEDFAWLCARRAVEMSHAGAAGAVDCRRLFVEIAAIAVAAIEAIDRKADL